MYLYVTQSDSRQLKVSSKAEIFAPANQGVKYQLYEIVGMKFTSGYNP